MYYGQALNPNLPRTTARGLVLLVVTVYELFEPATCYVIRVLSDVLGGARSFGNAYPPTSGQVEGWASGMVGNCNTFEASTALRRFFNKRFSCLTASRSS